MATEFAIVKVRETRIAQLSNAGEKKAIAAKKVVDHLDEYLVACQLGITITALGIGMVGESTFEFILHPLFTVLVFLKLGYIHLQLVAHLLSRHFYTLL